MVACDFSYLEALRAAPGSGFFIDQHDRYLLLHGVNISGTCKLPRGLGPDVLGDVPTIADTEIVDFIGRPFPMSEAHTHFKRVQSFGASIVRFVLTWEAVEIQPGVYDHEYLDYLKAILQEASQIGLLIVLDCHQDCWSRHCGGSGAPLWTLEKVGLQHKNFEECGAALVHEPDFAGHAEAGTLWATNYTKFAVNTMFTLFFAGEVFAPHAMIGDENMGAYLRRHYIDCFCTVLEHVKDIKGIVGIDVMNEPHHGFIGLDTLEHFDENVLLHLGDMPSAVQSMRLAAGIPQVVSVYQKSWPVPTRKMSSRILNSGGTRAWRTNCSDIWHDHGVWDHDSSRDSYFAKFPKDHPQAGTKVKFIDHFYVPFLENFISRVAEVAPAVFVMIEPVPNTTSNFMDSFTSSKNICFAPHWYDLKALFEKRFSSWMTLNVQALSRGSRNLLAHSYFGRAQAKDNYAKQYAAIFADAPRQFPRLVGETGIPFDMNKHYKDDKNRGSRRDYSSQGDMLDIMCTALERNMLSYTLWNYTPENRAYAGGGDLWNGEDFSLYCESEVVHNLDVVDRYVGSRAPESWIRPTATKIAGVPLRSEFDLATKHYVLAFRPAQGANPMGRETEIFLPRLHYGDSKSVLVETFGVKATWHFDFEEETLYFRHENDDDQQQIPCTLHIRNTTATRSPSQAMMNSLFLCIALGLIVVAMTFKVVAI